MTKITRIVLACLIFGTFQLVFSDSQNDAASQPESGAEAADDQDRAGSRVNRDMKNNVLIRPSSGQSTYNRLECYACVDCPQVLPTTPVKFCPYTPDPAKQNRCIVYAEKYKNMNHPIYIRGCVSERSTCSEIRKSHANNDVVSVVSCHECVGDGCNTNSASRYIFDQTMAFFVIVITPLMAKYTLQ